MSLFPVSDPCKAFNDLSCNHACIIVDGDAHCACDIGYYLDSDKQTCLGKCENTC